MTYELNIYIECKKCSYEKGAKIGLTFPLEFLDQTGILTISRLRGSRLSTSQHYCIEGFKGAPQLGPIYATTSQYYRIEGLKGAPQIGPLYAVSLSDSYTSVIGFGFFQCRLVLPLTYILIL